LGGSVWKQGVQMTKTDIMTDALTTKLVSIVDKWSSSFWRLTVPAELFSNSIIEKITEESGNAISEVLMYGERRGSLEELPYDHRELKNTMNDVAQESLWLYDNKKTQEIPTGFQSVKQPVLYIPTGKTNRCHKCSGQGQVKCWHCNGRGSVKRRKDGRTYWEPCSWCAGGFVKCNHCAGYGWVQTVIKCTTEYKTSLKQDFEYKGPVPQSDFAKAAGQVLFEEIIDYPQDALRPMLMGGLDAAEYSQLQSVIKEKLRDAINQRLTTYEGDLGLVHNLVENFIDTMPNPAQDNQLLKYEIVPVRIQIKVERKPVYKVTYTYKSDNYELWVYGTDHRVYAPQRPREFTNKAITFLVIMAILLIVIIVISLNPSLIGL
jgi:hypothetical protein